MISLNKNLCNGCSLCAQVCFYGNFSKAEDGKMSISDNGCMLCGHCMAVCPSKAITIDELKDIRVEDIDKSPLMDYESLLKLIKMRRSRREFTDQAVSDEDIYKLLDAAVQAPNALNKQEVYYTVVTDPNALKNISKMSVESLARIGKIANNPLGKVFFRTFMRTTYDGMAEILLKIDFLISEQAAGNDMVLYNAPCVILVHTPKSAACGSEDSVYAAASMLYSAETLDLGTCVIGFLTGPANHNPALKKLLQIPVDHIIHTTLAVGHPKFKYARPAPRKCINLNIIKSL